MNASNIEKDEAWIRANAAGDVAIRNTSESTGLIALQGPKSVDVLAGLGAEAARTLKRFRYDQLEIAGRKLGISRTGYTGADGFELYCDAADAEPLFEALLAAGEPLGTKPCGLGARDTLRLEAALPLYGHELDDETSPLEAGLDRSSRSTMRSSERTPSANASVPAQRSPWRASCWKTEALRGTAIRSSTRARRSAS